MWNYTDAPINKMMLNNYTDLQSQNNINKISNYRDMKNKLTFSYNNRQNQDSSSESSQRVDEFEDNTFEQNKWSNKHMKIENEGYKQTYNNFRNRISSSPIDVPSNSMEFLRVEENIHEDNIELPIDSDKTETETYNCASIPDEVDSIKEDYSFELNNDRNQINFKTFVASEQLKSSTLVEQSRCDDINSIFCSDSLSNESQSKTFVTEKDYVEICKELNDMAVDLIKKGIRIQEGEDEDGEGDENEQEKIMRAYEIYQQAKSYLNACLKHANNNIQHFDDTYVATFHYNLACLYQKIPELDECSKHLSETL